MRTSILGSATRVEPGPDDRASASSVREAVAGVARLVLCFPDGREIELPDTLVTILHASAVELAEGHAVTVLASDVLLSPAEAAKLLGLSRPFVVRLLDQGDLPSEHLPHSRHRVVRLADVVDFRARREQRREGRRRIADIVESDELPY